MIRKVAWPFYRTISGVRLYWELEEPKGPKSIRHSIRDEPHMPTFPLSLRLTTIQLSPERQGVVGRQENSRGKMEKAVPRS